MHDNEKYMIWVPDPNIGSRVYKERECRTPYCCVQTLFEEHRGQLVQYCTLGALTYPQTSGLVTTTTATSALQEWYCGHTPGCSYLTVMLALALMDSLTPVLFKECSHYGVGHSLSSSLLFTLDRTKMIA